MSNILYLILVSAVPLIEQKGAIPLGIWVYKMNPVLVYFVTLLGALLPIPFVLLMFHKILKWLEKYEVFSSFYNLIQRKIHKNKGLFEKYGELALIIFIAIPLPTTGVWTGTAICAFLNFSFKKSTFCGVVGAALCGLIVSIIAVYSPAMLGY